MIEDELLLMYNILVKAKSPYDIFKSPLNLDDVSWHYKHIIKIIHPDHYNGNAKLVYMAEEATKILNHFHQEAKDIISGKAFKPISSFNNTVYDTYFKIKNYEYSISSKYINDNFCKVYFGERKLTLTDSELICLKISNDIDDNFLLQNESHLLKKIMHKSMPILLDNFISNDGNEVNVMRRIDESYDLVKIKEMFPGGVPQEHVVWMMDRLLSVIGYLHINNVIHGAIEPGNILITPSNHNATLIDYTFAIVDAHEPDAKYYGVNDFSAPEIDGSIKPHPATDMYSFGKVMEYIITDNKGIYPIKVDKRIKKFISGFLEKDPLKRSNDAWKSWHELKLMRKEIFGSMNQFLSFNIK
jgi:serine/threonine protein kinase